MVSKERQERREQGVKGARRTESNLGGDEQRKKVSPKPEKSQLEKPDSATERGEGNGIRVLQRGCDLTTT